MRTLMVGILSAIVLSVAAVAAPPVPAAGAPVPAPASKAGDAFAQRMDEVMALEAAGDFRKATILLRKMRQEFRDGKQILAIDDAMERVRGLSEAGVGANDALTQLGSSDRRVADVARKQLLNSGAAGLIMLRKALQTGTAIAAANAADAVAESKDKESVPLLFQRLQAEKGRSALALTIMKALGRMQKVLTVEQLAECDKILETAEGVSRCEMADVLQAALETRAGGKEEDYEKLIGRPGAYERLRETYSRAIVSGDESLINWACREGTLFLPSVRGFRATYYSDVGFVNTALERFEPTIEKKPEDPLPYPNGQKTTLSISWQADLTISSPGAYTFAMQADDSGAIYLNGSNVVSTWGGQGRGSQPLNLTAGVYRIKVDYVQEQDASYYKVWWAGPGFQDAVNLPVSTRPMPEQMIKLVRTLDQLTSTNWAASRAVKDRVLSGGEAGMMVLRDAVVRREEPIAIAAMEFLSTEYDTRLIPALIRRACETNTSPLLRLKIAEAMCTVGATATDADCRALLAGLAGEGGPDRRVAIAGLCAVLERRCGGKEDEFNKRCGKADAYASLKAAVDRMFESKEQADAMWLAAFGQPFVVRPNGLHGKYWRGGRNDQFAFERVDGQLDLYENIAGMTDAGVPEFSATWDGFLWVPADGEYKFYLRGQNDARLYLDDEWLMGNGNRGAEPSVVRKLTKGSHRIRGSLRFWWDRPAMHVQWEGPNMPKQFVPWWCLSAAPSMTAVTNAAAALAKLPGLTNPDVAIPAQRAVRALGGAAAPLLLQTIRDGQESAAAEAIAVLLESPKEARDARATSVLVTRSEKVASPALRLALAQGLRGTADTISEADCKRMLATLKSGAGMDRNLAMAGVCAVLDRVCGGKAEEFNKRCGEVDAYETVKTAVSQALSSKDVDEISMATAFGQPFAPMTTGVRARYWRGSQFDLPVIDRREERIEQYERIPGITEQNPVELSARWEGYLNAPADGDYRFIVGAQNEGKLWIDDQQVVVQSGHRGQEGAGPAKLTAGRHRIKAELRFWNDWPGMRVWWEGPNLPRQIVASPYLSAEPSPAMVTAAAKALTRMRGLDNEGEYMACRRSVQALGAAAGPMLRRVLQDGPDSPGASEAMRFLIEIQDAATVPTLVAQIRTNQALRVNPLVVDTMAQLASSVDADTLAWCLGEVRQAATPDMDACLAVLCRVYLNMGGGDPGPLNRLVKDPKAHETIKAAVAAALNSPDRKVLARALRYGQPFAPFVGGATARYYFGDRFDKLYVEKQEWGLALWEYRGPQGWREENVSAIYEGFINAPQAGDSVFRINARGEGTLWLDGKPFLAVGGGREEAKGINMSAGFHPFRFTMRQPGRDFGFFLDTDRTPMNGGRARVDGNLVVSPPSASLVASLEKAAGDLEDKDPNRVSGARAFLNGSGEPGLAFIRNVALNAPEKVASSMAGLIISQRPPDAAKILLAMMRRNPKSDSMPTLVAALAAVAEQIQSQDALWINDGTPETTGLSERQQLQLLAAIADRACLGDKTVFQTLLKTKGPQVWDTLSQRFTAMTEAVETNNLFWALQYGGPFVPRVPGVRGKFYDGLAFDRPYADMREDCVDRQNEPFHNHGNPLSAWWTGTFEVKQAGRFKIGLRADDFARVWVDGRLVVDGWTSGLGQNLAGETDLSVGWHTFDVRYRQLEGDRYVFVNIQGPGMNGRFDQSFVRCTPPPAVIEWLYKELEKLGNDNQVNEGRNAANQMRPMSDMFLRAMVRFSSPKQAERAAGILADWKDTAAKPLIQKRAASTPDANLRKALEEAAKRIP